MWYRSFQPLKEIASKSVESFQAKTLILRETSGGVSSCTTPGKACFTTCCFRLPYSAHTIGLNLTAPAVHHLNGAWHGASRLPGSNPNNAHEQRWKALHICLKCASELQSSLGWPGNCNDGPAQVRPVGPVH